MLIGLIGWLIFSFSLFIACPAYLLFSLELKDPIDSDFGETGSYLIIAGFLYLLGLCFIAIGKKSVYGYIGNFVKYGLFFFIAQAFIVFLLSMIFPESNAWIWNGREFDQ